MAKILEARLTLGNEDQGMIPVELQIDVEFKKEYETEAEYQITWYLMGKDRSYDDELRKYVEGSIHPDRGGRHQTFTFNTSIYVAKLNEDIGGEDEVYASVLLEPHPSLVMKAKSNVIHRSFSPR